MAEFTRNWVKSKWKNWEKHFGALKTQSHVNYLEIGVFEGRSVCWMFENLLIGPNAVGIGIDPYIFGKKELMDQRQVIQQRCIENVSKFNFSMVFRPSQEVLLEKQQEWENRFDLIYVDGLHDCMSAYMDLRLLNRIMKKDCFVICDDYGLDLDRFNRSPYDSPKPAVDKYIEEMGEQCEVLWQELQVGLKITKTQTKLS